MRVCLWSSREQDCLVFQTLDSQYEQEVGCEVPTRTSRNQAKLSPIASAVAHAGMTGLKVVQLHSRCKPSCRMLRPSYSPYKQFGSDQWRFRSSQGKTFVKPMLVNATSLEVILVSCQDIVG